MWLVFAAPLGSAFGFTTWALLRGRGGFSGLTLLTSFGAIAAFIGGLAAEAIAGYPSDAITGLGAAVGALTAMSLAGLSFGSRALPATR
jgi:hypothetical protein